MKFPLICAFVLVLGASALARVINIPADYATIQAGIDASVDGDTVLVAPGVYRMHGASFQGKNIVLAGESGPEVTTIEHDMPGWVLFSINGGETVDAVIQGFTITNCHSPAIFVENNSSITVKGNIFRDNFGGELVRGQMGDWIRVIDNDFINNFNTSAGTAIYSLVTSIYASGNRFIANACSLGYGAIIFISNGDHSEVDHNLFYQNRCNSTSAGMVYLEASWDVLCYNNTIAYNVNRQSEYGAGITLSGCFTYNVYNNIVTNNQGIGITSTFPDSEMIRYNDVWGNTIDYANIVPGEGSISLNPVFVGGEPYSFRLSDISPCIDAGDPSSPLDPDSTRADIGAYYFDQPVGIDDDGAPSGPRRFSLKQNYPNPFNGQTIISYYLDKESTVSLHIYSIMGHLILPFVNKEIQSRGEHKYVWEGKGSRGNTVSTGIYFYELYVNESKETKAMIMIK